MTLWRAVIGLEIKMPFIIWQRKLPRQLLRFEIITSACLFLNLRQLQCNYFYSGCMAKLYSQVTLNLLHKVAIAISWVAFAYGTVTLKRHSVGRLAMCLFPHEARSKALQIEVYRFVQKLPCVWIMHGSLRVKWTPFSFISNSLASNKSATKKT